MRSLRERFWRAFIGASKWCNARAHRVKIKGTPVGSGKPQETLCAYWHHARESARWADLMCRFLDFFDCEHCRKNAARYGEKARWLLGEK